jgi:outer membrane receptor for ferrienterochelin and colicins
MKNNLSLPLRPLVIAVAAAITLPVSVSLHAQEAEASLSEIVVTASGFEQAIADAPASVSIITREELQKRPFRDLTDALSNVEGVAITGVANEKDIFMRGLPGAYTLILVDGKRQSTRDARTNGNSGFEQSFIPPLEAIDRIEVVRGPMSSLYGSDAMGGVINVITRKVPAKWGGSVGVDYTMQEHGDSGDSGQAQFYLGGPIKSDLVGLQIWGRQYSRDEDRILSGINRAKDRDVTARLAITPNKDHEILLQAGTTNVKRYSTRGNTSAATAANSYNTNDRDHYSLSHTGRWGWATSEISLSKETAQRTSFSQAVGAAAYTRNVRAPEIENTVLDAKLNIPLGSHWVVVGGQINQGNLTDQNPGRRNGVDEQFKIKQQALFIEDEWKLTDKFALTGGLRLDDHEIYGKHWSPRLYGVWHATEVATIKGGVSKGFRAPDIRTIAPGYAYTTGGGGCTYGPAGTCGVIIGDPNLKPETSTSYELSMHLDNKAGLSGSATYFYTDFKDKVANALVYAADGVTPQRWSEDPNYRLWYNYNIDNATIQGVELTMRWQPVKTVTIKSNYTYTDSKQKGGVYDGYALTRTPKHMANLRADWNAGNGWNLWSALSYHGKEINAGARIGNNGQTVVNGVKEYKAYTVADLGASYAWSKNVTINAALYNIGDKRLDELTFNTIGDGRRLWVGLNTRF